MRDANEMQKRCAYIKSLVHLYKPKQEFGAQGPARIVWSGTSAQLTPTEIELFAAELVKAAAEARELNKSVGLAAEPDDLYTGF